MLYRQVDAQTRWPMLGLGTFKLEDRACMQIVEAALHAGYRLFDTAAFYENHQAVGKALKNSGLPRESYYVTTKVWHDQLAYDNVLKACDTALKELQLDYLDLYLIHWPCPHTPLQETFKAFKRLVEKGKVRHVGVSNFTITRLTQALKVAEVPIASNQVEYHPHLNQRALLEFCNTNRILLTAYCPLGRGTSVNEPCIVEIARKYGKTPAQTILRWLLQKDIQAIPKTGNPDRLLENIQVFDFELSPTDMQRIESGCPQQRLVDWSYGGFDQS